MVVLVLCLRVIPSPPSHGIDLPELTSIQMGEDAFWFSGASSTLIMRSADVNEN